MKATFIVFLMLTLVISAFILSISSVNDHFTKRGSEIHNNCLKAKFTPEQCDYLVNRI